MCAVIWCSNLKKKILIHCSVKPAGPIHFSWNVSVLKFMSISLIRQGNVWWISIDWLIDWLIDWSVGCSVGWYRIIYQIVVRTFPPFRKSSRTSPTRKTNSCWWTTTCWSLAKSTQQRFLKSQRTTPLPFSSRKKSASKDWWISTPRPLWNTTRSSPISAARSTESWATPSNWKAPTRIPTNQSINQSTGRLEFFRLFSSSVITSFLDLSFSHVITGRSWRGAGHPGLWGTAGSEKVAVEVFRTSPDGHPLFSRILPHRHPQWARCGPRLLSLYESSAAFVWRGRVLVCRHHNRQLVLLPLRPLQSCARSRAFPTRNAPAKRHDGREGWEGSTALGGRTGWGCRCHHCTEDQNLINIFSSYSALIVSWIGWLVEWVRCDKKCFCAKRVDAFVRWKIISALLTWFVGSNVKRSIDWLVDWWFTLSDENLFSVFLRKFVRKFYHRILLFYRVGVVFCRFPSIVLVLVLSWWIEWLWYGKNGLAEELVQFEYSKNDSSSRPSILTVVLYGWWIEWYGMVKMVWQRN